MRTATRKSAGSLCPLLWITVALPLGLAACNSGSNGTTGGVSTSMGTNGTGASEITSGTAGITSGSAAGSSGSSTGSTGSTAGGGSAGNVRLAGLVAESALAFDLCLAPHGTAFTDSSLGLLQGSALGVAGGLTLGQVSTYLRVAPGSYDVVIMNGGKPSGCESGYATAGGPITIPATGLTTLAMFGSPSAGTLEVTAFADDPGTPLPPGPSVRLVSAFGGIADRRFWNRLWRNLLGNCHEPRPRHGGVRPRRRLGNGYALAPAGLQGTVAMRQSGGNTLFVGDGYQLPSGGYGSLFLTGVRQAGADLFRRAHRLRRQRGPPTQRDLPVHHAPVEGLVATRTSRHRHWPVRPVRLESGCRKRADREPGGCSRGHWIFAVVGLRASASRHRLERHERPACHRRRRRSCSGPSILDLPGQVLAPATFNTLVAEGVLVAGSYEELALLMPVHEERAPAAIVEDGGVSVRFQTAAVGFGPVIAGTGAVGASFDALFTSTFGKAPTGMYEKRLQRRLRLHTPRPRALQHHVRLVRPPDDPGNAIAASPTTAPAREWSFLQRDLDVCDRYGRGERLPGAVLRAGADRRSGRPRGGSCPQISAIELRDIERGATRLRIAEEPMVRQPSARSRTKARP